MSLFGEGEYTLRCFCRTIGMKTSVLLLSQILSVNVMLLCSHRTKQPLCVAQLHFM
jgi:hypothetical protein